MNKVFRKILIILFWLGAWQLLARIVDNPVLVATPYRTLGTFCQLLTDGAFYQTVLFSVLRIGGGFGVGFLLAIVLAVGSSRFRLVEELLAPIVSLLKTVPMASVVVLLLIWWGTPMLSAWVSMLVVFPIIYIQMLEGLKHLDRELVEMGNLFGLPWKSRQFYLYGPTLRPYLFGSMKTALGMSWKSGVAADIIGMAEHSVGGELYLSKVYLDTPGVFAWTACAILLSCLFERLVLFLADRYMNLQPACRKPLRQKSRVHVIGFRDVEKRYGDKTVFEKENLLYERGGIYYLRQPSGAGKTTLLRMLAGLEQADGGQVMRPESCSMMFQEDRLCPDYSPVKNVELVTGDEARARSALEKLLEGQDLDCPCRELSGGMKRRVALVRAMEAQADWIFLDEPYTGMDRETRSLAERYILETKGERTLIIASHVSAETK